MEWSGPTADPGPGSRPVAGRRVCIVGASGKLGQYLVQATLDRGYQVVGVCRPGSVGKLDRFAGRLTLVPGATDDREVIGRAVAGCDAVLAVLFPWGVRQYASGTAQAVLDRAAPGARLVFSCGWEVPRDDQDVYTRRFRLMVATAGVLARVARVAELRDQVEAARRVYASDTRWTVARGSSLVEGESLGPPVWSPHVGDPALGGRSRLHRIDYARFMVDALDDERLVRVAPAIVDAASSPARPGTAPHSAS